jgi:all-trans-retinol 13,14-reductase
MKEIVIIGAGLGGLTAGALLSKEGHRVTLLEQHNIVGGCATTFKRKGLVCEVGLHEMDGVHTNAQIKKIFSKLGVYDNVEFVKVPEFFRVTTKDDTFTMPDGLEHAKEALIVKFPHEKDAIETYFTTLQTIALSLERLQDARWYHLVLFPFFFSTLLRHKGKSVSEVFEELFEDERLKVVLNANVQYYDDTPDTLSFLLHCVAQYSYYTGGGYFIKGGSGRLSDYLAQVIETNGGKVITNADAYACTPNKVSYTHRKQEMSIDADIIISNLSPMDTYRMFDVEYREQREIADSLLTIYLGFSKNIKEVYGSEAYSNFFFDDIADFGDLRTMTQKDISQRGFVFVDYSQIDASLTKDADRSFGVICMIDHLDEWKSLPKEAYQEKKQELEQTMIARLERHYPDISTLIDYVETGTAKTVQRYIRTPNGTAYGFRPTPRQFFKVPKVRSSKIKDLYFVGQWVIAGGFSPSITSGYLCYQDVLKRYR